MTPHPRVERRREAEVEEREAHVEEIAGEAIRTGRDDRRGRTRPIDVRARGAQCASSQNRDRDAHDREREGSPLVRFRTGVSHGRDLEGSARS